MENFEKSLIGKEITDESNANKDSFEIYLGDIADNKLLSKEKEVELFKQLETGDNSAKDKIVEANQRLVINIAKKFIKKSNQFSLNDLVQEGNIGLLKAIEKFDYNRGNKFSTYATWKIRQTIGEALIEKSREIHIPRHMLDKMSIYAKFINKKLKETGQIPSRNEIAKEFNMSIEEADELILLDKDFIYLDDEMQKNGSAPMVLVNGGKKFANPEDVYLKKEEKEILEKYLLSIENERKKSILEYCFLKLKESGERYTVDEIKDIFDISGTRVRQIKSEFLKDLEKLINEQEIK